jgi:hypothetical protein
MDVRLKLVSLAAAVLCGCASLSREQLILEGSYQALHVADTIQTLNIKKDNGYWERNPILGRHPSDTEVIAYMAGEAIAHALISKTLADRNAPDWLQRLWHYSSVSWNGALVISNHKRGL